MKAFLNPVKTESQAGVCLSACTRAFASSYLQTYFNRFHTQFFIFFVTHTHTVFCQSSTSQNQAIFSHNIFTSPLQDYCAVPHRAESLVQIPAESYQWLQKGCQEETLGLALDLVAQCSIAPQGDITFDLQRAVPHRAASMVQILPVTPKGLSRDNPGVHPGLSGPVKYHATGRDSTFDLQHAVSHRAESMVQIPAESYQWLQRGCQEATLGSALDWDRRHIPAASISQ